MNKPRTEPLRTFPEDAETPPPVPVAQEPARPVTEPDTFVFKDGQAFACDEGGKMVQVDFDQAAAAANHIGNADPAIRKRAAASCAAQFPVKGQPGTGP